MADMLLPLAEVFILLFVTLGPPLKVPALYLQATSAMPEGDARLLAARAFAFATVTALAGGVVGRFMMNAWHISVPAMMLAAGSVFLLVSLRGLLAQYSESAPVVDTTKSRNHTAYKIAVPMLLPPYGMAAIIVLLANSADTTRSLWICVLLAGIMVLNFLAMFFARQIMRTIGPIPLQIFGVIIGIMTMALSIQIIIKALRQLGVAFPGLS